MMADWINQIIFASVCFVSRNIDVDTACYLKCDDGTKCMRSDCVTALAPQALAWDWRLK